MEQIYDKIIKDYTNHTFDANYYFYPNRKDFKDIYRTGIINYNGKKYFFKIVENCDAIDEEKIEKTINPFNFHLVKKYGQKIWDKKQINLYEYIDAVNSNAYNFLRSKSTTFSEKEKISRQFFHNCLSLYKSTLTTTPPQVDEKNEQFFRGRCTKNERLFKYYGDNLILLESDLTNLGYHNIFNFIRDNFNYGKHMKNTLYAYSHGDFHDFNFCTNGIFWDTDTFGYNSILGDFTIYYWHFWGRENYLIPKYAPWHNSNMHDSLSKEERIQIYSLKKTLINDWWSFIYEAFKNINETDKLVKEFQFRVLCRIFLVDNVLKCDKIDRIKLYNYITHLKNCTIDSQGTFLFENNPFNI